MNYRYLITKETLFGQEYHISALYDEAKKMVEVLLDSSAQTQTAILGNIYIARVENVVKNLNAAFVKITPEQNCYLSLEDVKNPIFTKKRSVKKSLAAGDELLVQVSREALKTKEPAVTANLSLSGKYAVLTSGNSKMSVSAKLTKETRRHYKELLAKRLAGDSTMLPHTDAAKLSHGFIIRTNAAEVSDAVVLSELTALEERYAHLVKAAQGRTCYSLLYREISPHLKYLRDLQQDMLEEIVTDDRDIFAEICEQYHIPAEALISGGSVPAPVNEIVTENNIKIRHYTDTAISLSALYSVTSNIENALKERVWLKSGAYLIIQPTEALTVIDVNTGKNTAKKEMQENFLRINKEAAVEIARQMRLRNLSGIIIVDFMNLTAKDAREELLSVFRAALKKDPVPTQLIDITKLGLVEVTRKKVRKPLKEMLEKKEA